MLTFVSSEYAGRGRAKQDLEEIMQAVLAVQRGRYGHYDCHLILCSLSLDPRLRNHGAQLCPNTKERSYYLPWPCDQKRLFTELQDIPSTL
jgi:hypothetical protein